jgi:tape measure domain-containing protein
MATTTVNVSEIKNIATVDTRSALRKLKEYKKELESFKNIQIPKIGLQRSQAVTKMGLKAQKQVNEELRKQKEHRKMLANAEREAHRENSQRIKEAIRLRQQQSKAEQKALNDAQRQEAKRRREHAIKEENIDFTRDKLKTMGVRPDSKLAKSVEESSKRLRSGTISLKRYRHEVRMAEMENRRLARSTKTVGESFRSLRSMIVAATASMTLFAEGREIVSTGLEIEGLHLALKAITKDTGAATKEYEFFRGVVHQTGLDLLSSAKSFKIFTAAASTTTLKGEKARALFEETSKQIATLGLSADEAFGIFKAMGQIMSKNRVSAEELSNQLGDRMPGAVGLAAKAMNMTTKELLALVATGKLTAEEFLPKLTKALKDSNSGFAAMAEESKRIAFGRFKTAITDLRNTIFQGGFGQGLADLANTMSEILMKAKPLGAFLGGTFRGILLGLATPVMILVAALVDLVNILSEIFFDKAFIDLDKTDLDLIALTGTIGGLAIGLGALSVVLVKIVGIFKSLRKVALGASLAMWLNPLGIAVALFIGLAAGAVVFRDELKGVIEVMDKLFDKMESLSEFADKFQLGEWFKGLQRFSEFVSPWTSAQGRLDILRDRWNESINPQASVQGNTTSVSSSNTIQNGTSAAPKTDVTITLQGEQSWLSDFINIIVDDKRADSVLKIMNATSK